MAKMGAMEADCRQDRREIQSLTSEVKEPDFLRSHSLSMFLKGLNHARRMLKKNGGICFTLEQLERFSFRQVDQFLDNWSICL